jgi:hypothetical protein
MLKTSLPWTRNASAYIHEKEPEGNADSSDGLSLKEAASTDLSLDSADCTLGMTSWNPAWAEEPSLARSIEASCHQPRPRSNPSPMYSCVPV